MPISTIGSNSLNQTSDLTINGVTVGKGGGAVSTNTAVGVSALAVNQAGGTNNTAIGNSALDSNTTGDANTAVGDNALQANTTASNNTAVGYQALYSNTTAVFSTAVGYQAGYAATASYNTMFGAGAGSGASFTGNENTLVGYYAGNALTSGSKNTFVGPAFGNGCGGLITTGGSNTVIGGYSGNAGGIDIRTASNNIVLSDGDGNVKQWWSNNGYWEYNSGTQLRLPSTGGTGYIGYLADQNSIQVAYNSVSNGVRLTSGATSWSTWSDQRLKNVTGTYTTPLADISQLQPIKFTWKSDEENKPQVGILAQSLQSVVPEAVEEGTISLEDETKYLTVRYTELIPLMVASIKELKSIVDAQAAEIAELKAKVA
jgi:hypothetical protein